MNFLNDFRRAVRSLSKNAGFASACVLTLALGIGINTAIFSVVDAVMLRPLPYRDASQICLLWKSIPKKNIERDWTSYPTFQDWKRDNRTFDDLAVFLRPDGSRMELTDASGDEQIQAAKVSANFFSVMGVAPILGRTFAASEDGGVKTAVLSYGLWKRRFGSAPDVLGKKLEIDHASYEVVAVMPREFEFPYKEAEIWVPISTDARWAQFQVIRIADAFGVIGRLKAGVSRPQAQADISVVTERLAREHAATDADLRTEVVPLAQYIVGARLRATLWLFLAAVGLVLLIACANVAGLFLARTYSRRKSFAIQIALGAGRGHILRQLLAESMVMAFGAGGVGIFLAWMGIKVIAMTAPAGIPGLEKISLSATVLTFTLGVSLLSALILGIGPAWKFSGSDPQDALRERSASGGRQRNRMHGFLVFSESALAIVLLAGTGLLLRSFVRLEQVDLGFRPDHLISMHIHLAGAKYGTDDQIRAFVDAAILRSHVIPGVTSAAIGAVFLPRVPDLQVAVPGRDEANSAMNHEPVTWTYVSEDYFRTMEIPLLRGRTFTADDRKDSLPVIVMNQTMARSLFPGEDPLGKKLRFGKPGYLEKGELTIAGVVGDVVQNGPETRPISVFYFPVRQRVWDSLDLMVRTSADPVGVEAAVGKEIHALDSTISESAVTTVERQLRELESPRRFQIELFALFSFLAVFLAAVGIFGVMAYAVGQRTNEIGVRVALGAQRSDIFRLVIRQGLVPVVTGLVTGVGLALVLTRSLAGFLYGIKASDPVTYLGVCGLLLCVAGLAAWIPARRAMRTDPMIALRYE